MHSTPMCSNLRRSRWTLAHLRDHDLYINIVPYHVTVLIWLIKQCGIKISAKQGGWLHKNVCIEFSCKPANHEAPHMKTCHMWGLTSSDKLSHVSSLQFNWAPGTNLIHATCIECRIHARGYGTCKLNGKMPWASSNMPCMHTPLS